MSVLSHQEVSYIDRTGKHHRFTVTASPTTGQVWVPGYLPATEPRLAWIVKELGLRTSALNGTSGPAIFRVPRWEWDKRTEPRTTDGRAILR